MVWPGVKRGGGKLRVLIPNPRLHARRLTSNNQTAGFYGPPPVKYSKIPITPPNSTFFWRIITQTNKTTHLPRPQPTHVRTSLWHLCVIIFPQEIEPRYPSVQVTLGKHNPSPGDLASRVHLPLSAVSLLTYSETPPPTVKFWAGSRARQENTPKHPHVWGGQNLRSTTDFRHDATNREREGRLRRRVCKAANLNPTERETSAGHITCRCPFAAPRTARR